MVHPRAARTLHQLAPLVTAGSYALLAGCGGSDDEPNPSRDTNLTLEQACSASCDAQVATNCPGVPRAGQCIDACVAVPTSLPMCDQAWKNINACMARSPLYCDRVNGGAAVSSDHCGPEIDAMQTCTP